MNNWLKIALTFTAVAVAMLLGSIAGQDANFYAAAANCSWNSTVNATIC